MYCPQSPALKGTVLAEPCGWDRKLNRSRNHLTKINRSLYESQNALLNTWLTFPEIYYLSYQLTQNQVMIDLLKRPNNALFDAGSPEEIMQFKQLQENFTVLFKEVF